MADGSMLAADNQLAGAPSVLLDPLAVILSDEGAKALSVESAAIDFVRDPFGHLNKFNGLYADSLLSKIDSG